MTGCAKKVPDPMACRDGHCDLSVTLPFYREFHNRLFIFAFLRHFLYDSTTFATDPTVVGFQW